MKKINKYLKFIYIAIIGVIFNSCVHDDIYSTPDNGNAQCQELQATISIAQAKKIAQNTTITTDDVVEGYVCSSDESGNIYKYIYIQDNPTTPTQGFVVSVDAVSTYGDYPQGSKVYIKLKGLAMGTYGSVLQLGAMVNGVFDRIPQAEVKTHIFKSCSAKMTIVPKIMTLADMKSTNDQYIGCLVQVNNAEFDKNVLCTNYAPDGLTVDKQINDATSTSSSKVVRNSGFASFANQTLPSGNGKFVGILSKFNSTYQMFVNRASDLDMNKFPRLDGLTADPCSLNESNLTVKTVAEVKQLLNGGTNALITGNYELKAKVIANDETDNFFRYIYVEDATGGIRVNIFKSSNTLWQDDRFKVGKELIISLKNLYVAKFNGEIQIGATATAGAIAEGDIYKYFFDSNKPATDVTATERTISQISYDDVGKWIKIKDLQVASVDFGRAFALSSSGTNRTLEDCSGNKIILRTSNFATFAPMEMPQGKGDIYAVLIYFNGTYELMVNNLLNINFNNPRCDGTVPEKIIFHETFDTNLADPSSKWITYNVTGAQVWSSANFGMPSPCVLINGFAGGNQTNEDWLISKPISLEGLTSASLTFNDDVRFTGGTFQVMISDNYVTGSAPSTATWTILTPFLDTNTTSNNWTYSDKLNISTFVNKKISVAFKYTSNSAGAPTWELDNVIIKGK